MDDQALMQRALELADKARIQAPPNPWVGCVLVKDEKIIGEGFTQPAGSDHAEVVALKAAGGLAKGSVAYVTLEPCSHHGRTPPCVEALISAGVSRVVIGIQDPDTKVSGKGIETLKSRGISVTTGILQKQIQKQLAPYIHHRKTGTPYVVAKSAISLDGRVAAPDGTSQWISSEEARVDAHQLRAESSAILIGSQTAVVDSPRLTVRREEFMPPSQPLRVVMDTKGLLTTDSPLFSDGNLLIATTDLCPEEKINEYRRAGAEVFVLKSEEQRVPLEPLLHHLGERGVIQLLVEGGSMLLGTFLKEGRIQELVVYTGSLVLGGTGRPLFGSFEVETLTDAPKLILEDIKVFGNTVKAIYSL